MCAEQGKSTEGLSQASLSEMTNLFTQVPPKMLREALLKLYLAYITNEDADLPQDVEKIDKPIRSLLTALDRIVGIDRT